MHLCHLPTYSLSTIHYYFIIRKMKFVSPPPRPQFTLSYPSDSIGKLLQLQAHVGVALLCDK